MKPTGKPSTLYSDNPKMGQPYVPSGKGYQDGGKVLPASKMDGGVFVRAAQGADLPTDNATLNKIVNLVNQGYNIARATQMVKDGRAGKPEGYKDGGRIPDEEDVLKNVDISASGDGRKSTSYGYGGRMGVNLPIDKERDLSVGVSGGGYREGSRREFNVTGADISYRKGDTTIGVEVGKQPGKMGDKRVMFRYKKEF